MNIYKDVEKELAELLGWTEIEYSKILPKSFIGKHKNSTYNGQPEDKAWLPEWCSDDASAFKLMIEFYCGLDSEGCEGGNGYDVQVYCGNYYIKANVGEHNHDKSLAARYAIVQSVISKLKGSK